MKSSHKLYKRKKKSYWKAIYFTWRIFPFRYKHRSKRSRVTWPFVERSKLLIVHDPEPLISTNWYHNKDENIIVLKRKYINSKLLFIFVLGWRFYIKLSRNHQLSTLASSFILHSFLSFHKATTGNIHRNRLFSLFGVIKCK